MAVKPIPVPCSACGSLNLVWVQVWIARSLYIEPSGVRIECADCRNTTRPELTEAEALGAWVRQAEAPKDF